MKRGHGLLGSALLLLLAAFALLPGPGADAQPARVRPLAVAGVQAVPDQPCPAKPSSAPGANYAGQRLVYRNFSRQDLTNADFSGAVITGSVFLHAKLNGANFSGATIVADRLPTDFTFADLTHACLQGVKYQGTTYFTYATLSCADFSATANVPVDLSANVVFGDAKLKFDTGDCRPAFRNVTLNCEFLAQWNALDLSGAGIAGCNALLKPGHDFSNARMAGVTFDNLDLTGSKWAGAIVTGASFQGATLDNATGLAGTQANNSLLALTLFNGASLKNVDLSYAQLYGANFTYANLENANLQGAFLTNNTKVDPPIDSPADFTGAHLKNVNLANAHLRGAVMDHVSFYGSSTFRTPPATCSTDLSTCPGSATGATCGCATASGADLTATIFSNAFLYGVDFSGKGTNVNGTNFSGAILVSANFSGATWSVDPQKQGAPPLLQNAYLQGVDMHDANLTDAVLTGAYVDFGAPGNTSDGNVIALKLGADYAKFRGWPPSPNGVCVQVNYGGAPPVGHFSLLPTTTRMTCPNGKRLAAGCGQTDGGPDSAWRSGTPLASAASPGYYADDATFDTADPRNPACNIAIRNRDW